MAEDNEPIVLRRQLAYLHPSIMKKVDEARAKQVSVTEKTYLENATQPATTSDVELANLVSSSLGYGNLHAPTIDIDVPARLVPSTTPGHTHLYIDVPMTWENYEKLLTVLVECGIVEPGYLKASQRHQQSYVRRPHVKKTVDDLAELVDDPF